MSIKSSLYKIRSYFKPAPVNNMVVFNQELAKIDSTMGNTESPDIPRLFKKIPLDVFGRMLLDIPPTLQHIKAYFPSMVSDDIQKKWTGSHGSTLLNQSIAFTKTMIDGYASITGKPIEDAVVLDFGCGWGRIIRLLYKFIPINNIYGVDPWDESINICEQNGVKGKLAISDWVPHALPFEQRFDLIYAFSVFTHLSEKTTRIVLDTLRKYFAENGVLIITIRPKEYWHIHANGAIATEMLKLHDEKVLLSSPTIVSQLMGILLTEILP